MTMYLVVEADNHTDTKYHLFENHIFALNTAKELTAQYRERYGDMPSYPQNCYEFYEAGEERWSIAVIKLDLTTGESTPLPKTLIEVWVSSFVEWPGSQEKVSKIGEIYATDFIDACRQLYFQDALGTDGQLTITSGVPAMGSCVFFENETDAQAGVK